MNHSDRFDPAREASENQVSGLVSPRSPWRSGSEEPLH